MMRDDIPSIILCLIALIFVVYTLNMFYKDYKVQVEHTDTPTTYTTGQDKIKITNITVVNRKTGNVQHFSAEEQQKER